MENQYPTMKVALPGGIMLGVLLILLVVVLYVTGMQLEGVQWPMYLFYLAFPFIIIFTIKSYRTKNGGYLTLGQALKVGVTVAVLSGLVYAVYAILFATVIDPGFADEMMVVARDQMFEQNPDMTDEQADIAMGFVEKFSNPFLASAFWIIMSALFGFVYSLIGGLIFKREQPIQQ